MSQKLVTQHGSTAAGTTAGWCTFAEYKMRSDGPRRNRGDASRDAKFRAALGSACMKRAPFQHDLVRNQLLMLAGLEGLF